MEDAAPKVVQFAKSYADFGTADVEPAPLPPGFYALGLSEPDKAHPDHLDVFFGLTKTPEREKVMGFSRRPIYSVKNILVARADDDVKISALADVRTLKGGKTILANMGMSQATFLKKFGGLTVDEGVSSTEANLVKLVAGRGRFVFAADMGIYYALTTFADKDKVRILPLVVEEIPQYIGYSLALPKAVTDRIDAAVDKLLNAGELGRIFKKYVQ